MCIGVALLGQQGMRAKMLSTRDLLRLKTLAKNVSLEKEAETDTPMPQASSSPSSSLSSLFSPISSVSPLPSSSTSSSSSSSSTSYVTFPSPFSFASPSSTSSASSSSTSARPSADAAGLAGVSVCVGEEEKERSEGGKEIFVSKRKQRSLERLVGRAEEIFVGVWKMNLEKKEGKEKERRMDCRRDDGEGTRAAPTTLHAWQEDMGATDKIEQGSTSGGIGQDAAGHQHTSPFTSPDISPDISPATPLNSHKSLQPDSQTHSLLLNEEEEPPKGCLEGSKDGEERSQRGSAEGVQREWSVTTPFLERTNGFMGLAPSPERVEQRMQESACLLTPKGVQREESAEHRWEAGGEGREEEMAGERRAWRCGADGGVWRRRGEMVEQLVVEQKREEEGRRRKAEAEAEAEEMRRRKQKEKMTIWEQLVGFGKRLLARLVLGLGRKEKKPGR
ncbi:uncharacterized protein MONOS_16817 [Monocercomonoides exilis]|uniref:uncharacterized protein n=1 Tax=Monocercomonoides exilis TaxID=2049356 RepID=UPI00355A5897|nr:hypothetical protein MONOS_16817 [Monocercomonoides exilis]|eukprot:MONOS_16817.1-p1 / transcript=MONOS_16817.1 / gene=MONOS_16817 / organism=Monocercomonoides_exilis_PA203 / gene_product=unspecified product / transcript_product=unspecified product / location=Mono_scaffold00008:267906-269249(-) / protein_length=448 / sequence_SO=supercontig / SO=protein_coding / is_pseudo=false